MSLVRFRNCTLIRHHALLVDDLWVRDGRIIDPQEIFFGEKCQADVEYDCRGVLIAPGYIDLQINGAFGHDFSSPGEASEEMLTKVAQQLTSHGVTAFAPTVVSSNIETYKAVLPKYKRRAGSARDGAAILGQCRSLLAMLMRDLVRLGIHVEGPFIDEKKRGAHRTDFLRQSPHGIEDLLTCYGSFDNVSIVTVAPEIPRMIEDVIPALVEKYGVVVSVGHSVASLDDGERAVCAGARFITHLFNAMLPFHHRDPGLVGRETIFPFAHPSLVQVSSPATVSRRPLSFTTALSSTVFTLTQPRYAWHIEYTLKVSS